MQSTMISSFLLLRPSFSSSSTSDHAFSFLISFFFMYNFALLLTASHRDDSRRCNAAYKHITKCGRFPVSRPARLQYRRPYRYNRETNEEQKLTIMLLQNFMPCAQSFTMRYNLLLYLNPFSSPNGSNHTNRA